jgi:hypothetical protein
MSRPLKAIETQYAGCRFRSRLEARWAVFFDVLGIAWEYEPEGFELPSGPYLPDFLLDCGTWVEVKGDPARLDKARMVEAANHLPPGPVKDEAGPALLILGPIPSHPVLDVHGNAPDWCWLGMHANDPCLFGAPVTLPDSPTPFTVGSVNEVGFGAYRKKSRPWWDCGAFTYEENWLIPHTSGSGEDCPVGAYTAARSARFEFGQSGAPAPRKPQRWTAPAAKPPTRQSEDDCSRERTGNLSCDCRKCLDAGLSFYIRCGTCKSSRSIACPTCAAQREIDRAAGIDMNCSRERTGSPFCPCVRCVRERRQQPSTPCKNPSCQLPHTEGGSHA